MSFGSEICALASCGRPRDFRLFFGARRPVHIRCFVSANGVKCRLLQRGDAAVRIPGRDLVIVAPAVPRPFVFVLCRSFIAAVLVASVKLLLWTLRP
jgi:hypothetical protein